ncbi:putative quinol monooxygenase [Sphingosinicella microcystinivorans]|uniref:putative quinol monooxygenase n=1 Tax=Sphingosinicella microcystinivorans TaxID=335406 RepID=UPI0022F38363|nr:putative quinol monooxygenase [Sphingosinicella microcystinivorans]WBX86197.1 putative quinol monooxygenase [Sphingosinicella microcystinivorans]
MARIANFVNFQAKPGKDTELGQALAALVEPTRNESGCIRYDLYSGDGGRWSVHEIWRDEAAIQFHLEQPYIVDFIEKMPGLIALDPAVSSYRPVDVRV